MVSPRKTTFAGLNTFNPQAVTPDIENHNVLASVSDQIVVGDTRVLENRLSVKQFDSTIHPSQGAGPMVLAPDVNSGSYFNDQDRTSRRVEWLTTYAFTPLGPEHLVKAGTGVTYEMFDGISRSRPVDIVRESGTLSQEITFRIARGQKTQRFRWKGRMLLTHGRSVPTGWSKKSVRVAWEPSIRQGI